VKNEFLRVRHGGNPFVAKKAFERHPVGGRPGTAGNLRCGRKIRRRNRGGRRLHALRASGREGSFKGRGWPKQKSLDGSIGICASLANDV
jgi:hypothetical protein